MLGVEPNRLLSLRIAEQIAHCNDIFVVEPVKIGESDCKNELLLFVKPEMFIGKRFDPAKRFIDLILHQFQLYDVFLGGVIIVGGKALQESHIVETHYGKIHELSISASKILTDHDRAETCKTLALSSLDDFDILGGHEFLRNYPDTDIYELSRIWYDANPIKLRGGCYVEIVKKDNRNLILVNGFHPAQLEQYTEQSHRIVLMVIHSNSSWSVLRNQMVGTTFPHGASPKSIRGILFNNPKDFGQDSVSLANNGVHLSAGPFEGMFEIVNFFGRLSGLEIDKNPPLLLKQMFYCGIEKYLALKTLENPIISVSDGPIDLFTMTEELDSAPAIELWKCYLDTLIV